MFELFQFLNFGLFCVLHLCFQSVETAPKLDSQKNGVCIGIYSGFKGCACRGGVTIYIYMRGEIVTEGERERERERETDRQTAGCMDGDIHRWREREREHQCDARIPISSCSYHCIFGVSGNSVKGCRADALKLASGNGSLC